MSFKHSFWGFLLGGLVGSLSALFWLPANGKQNRMSLLNKSEDLKESVKQTITHDELDESLLEGKKLLKERQGLDSKTESSSLLKT